ncbi:MAG: hypothetical protein WC840_03425 [Candidatus Peribacteraceae bacterium]
MTPPQLKQFSALVLYADILGTEDSLKNDEEGYVRRFLDLWCHARDYFGTIMHGKLSRILCIYDNIWARVTADENTEAISPDNQVIDLFPDLLSVAISTNEKAIDCNLEMIQTIAFGKLWMNDEDLCYPVEPSTATPITENIFSLGKPQLRCVEIFKSKKLRPNSIGIDEEIINALDGDEFYPNMRDYGYQVSFKKSCCKKFYSVKYDRVS